MITSEKRIYIIFRADLPEMTRAKGEVQAAHAVGSLIYANCVFHPTGFDHLSAYMNLDSNNKEAPQLAAGQAKICMEVDNLDALLALKQRAINRKVLVVDVTDEGRTVFAEPTTTCIAFGPCSKTDGNAISRGARMRE